MPHPLYLLEQGSVLSRSGQRLVVTRDGTVLAEIATLQVSQVLVFGTIQITTPALQLLLREGIEVVLLSLHGVFYGRVTGPMNGHGALRMAQTEHARDPAWALATAQAMVRGKLQNSKVFLQRYARRMTLPGVRAAADSIDALIERVGRTTTINSLMGVEGQATALYFGVWKALLKAPWSFERRSRRPPVDPVNVLLSFGYTLLLQNVWGAVLAAGLEPYIGFLHQVGYNKPSLALDLAEEFRPVVVDSVVLRCLNNAIVRLEHFAPGDAEQPIVLLSEGSKLFIRELEGRLTQSFVHPESHETVTWRRVFHLQARRMAAAILEEGAPGYRPFVVR